MLDNAAKYRDLIYKAPTDILATTLWSAANSLRARHEAHQSADTQARLNDMLPPNTAAALQDLLETHGIFFLGHPGAAEVERKRREFLSGPRNPDARGAADRLATSLIDTPQVLSEDAAAPLAMDQEASQGQGPSARMTETSLIEREVSIFGAIARWAKNHPIIAVGAGIAGGGLTAIGHAELATWWMANKPLIFDLFIQLNTKVPPWLDWLASTMDHLRQNQSTISSAVKKPKNGASPPD